MPRLYVVLDTNAYIGISDADLEGLIECCAVHSIVGVASFWVAQELLSHVADQADRDFGRARAAIRRLARHCSQYDGARSIVRFIGDGHGTVNRERFGRPGADEDDSSDDYGTLLGVI